jgi:hypothetical protein
MRKITDKTQDINKELSTIKDMTAQFGDRRVQQLMEQAFKAGHQNHINQEKEKQGKLSSYLDKHFIPLEKMQEDPVIYFIAERQRVFTSEANKFNLLYVGESTQWSQRRKKYEDVDGNNNEMVEKIINRIKFEEDGGMWIDDTFGVSGKYYRNQDKSERLERIKNLLRGNLVVKVIKRKRYVINSERIMDEAKFVNRFKPLLNVGHVQNKKNSGNSLKDDLNECFTKEELQHIITSVEEEQRDDSNKYSHNLLSNQIVLIRTGVPKCTDEQVIHFTSHHPEYAKLCEKGLVGSGDVTLKNVNYMITETLEKNKLNADIAKELGIKTSVVNTVMDFLVKLPPIRKTTYFSFRYKAMPKNSRIPVDHICGEDVKKALSEEETVPQDDESRQEGFNFTNSNFQDIFNDFFPGGERPTNGKL